MLHRRENVVILRMGAMSLEMQVSNRQLVDIAVVFLDKRTAGRVAVDHQFENILPQTRIGKVPAIVVSLHIEIEPVLPVHPTDLDGQVELLRIEVLTASAMRIVQLRQSNRIGIGHHIPIRKIAVDTRNSRPRKLENPILLLRPGEPERLLRAENAQQNSQ